MQKKYLTLFALVLLIVAPIDSIRNLPLAALFGSSLLFFILFAALFFLIPSGLVSAQLASNIKGKGGIYHWVSEGLGKKMGMLAVWLQWANTLIWFPAILSFIAGTAAYFVNPALAANKTYLVTSVLIIFWTMTLVNLRGVHRSASFGNLFFILGTVVPMILLACFAAYWVVLGHPTYLHFDLPHLIPHFNRSSNWISLTAIITSFVGIELATVHINEVRDPEKAFPKALMIAVIFVIISMALGSLSIALVIPAHQLNLVDGVMQVFSFFLDQYHLSWISPVLILMVILGCLGGMVSWIISPAQGLLQAAEHQFLPPFFTVTNRHGVPHHLLLLQGVLVTLACLAFELMPSINGSYWLLADLSTELSLLLYVLMFIAAWKLYPAAQPGLHEFRIPGKRFGTLLTVVMGLIGCLIPFIVGFIPPDSIDVGGVVHYECIFSLGLIFLVGGVFFFYGYQASLKRQS